MGLSCQYPQQVEAGNIHHLVMDIFWFGLALPATARFVATYAIRVGASPQEIGWLTAAPALVLLISTILSNWWRRRYPDAAHAVIWPGLGFRLAFLLPVFTPFLPVEWQPAWLIFSVSLPALPQGVSSVVFLVMMREAVSIEKITTLLSRRNFAFNASFGVSTFALGMWLARTPFPFNYQTMFVLAFTLTLVSLWHVRQTRSVCVMPVSRQAFPVKLAWYDLHFREVTRIVILAHLAVFFVAPLIPIYLMDTLGADENTVALFVFVELAGGAGVSVFLPYLTQKVGSRRLLAPAMFGMAVSTLLIALTPHLAIILFAAWLGGVCWTIEGVSLFGYFSEKTPPDQVTDHTIIYNQATFLSMFIAPLLSTQLVDMRVDIIQVMLVGVGLRLVGGLLIQGLPLGNMRLVTHWSRKRNPVWK